MNLTEEQIQIQTMAKDFAMKEWLPNMREWDRDVSLFQGTATDTDFSSASHLFHYTGSASRSTICLDSTSSRGRLCAKLVLLALEAFGVAKNSEALVSAQWSPPSSLRHSPEAVRPRLPTSASTTWPLG